MYLNTMKIVTVALMAALASGCSDESDHYRGDSGTLSLSLTDAPVDNLLSVFMTFSGVTLQAAGGKRSHLVFPEPIVLDLLGLQHGMTAALMQHVEIPAGRYSWLRLDLSEAPGSLYVRDNVGGQYPLVIPSGAKTGLKLPGGFTVLANGQSDFTIDFDLRKSVTLRGGPGSGDYLLRPTLRLVDNAEAGAIGGQVDTTLIQSQCDNLQLFSGVMYIFAGADAQIDDYDAESGGAVVAVPVLDRDGDGRFNFTAAFLPEGEYTAAYTCDIDSLDADETLLFTGPVNVTVTAGASTIVNL